MKPIAISSYLAFAALSLYAADPQASKDNATPKPATHTQTLFSAQPAGIADSPLVRAAKATNRLGKKPFSQVITNDTLVRDGGHFTTTTVESQAQLPAGNKQTGTSFDQMAAEVRRARAEAAAGAEQTRKTEEQKKTAAGRAAARAQGDTPEGLYGDPPALEAPIQTVKPIAPEIVPTKPPQ